MLKLVIMIPGSLFHMDHSGRKVLKTPRGCGILNAHRLLPDEEISYVRIELRFQQGLLSKLLMGLDVFYFLGSWFMIERFKHFQTTHCDDGMKLKCMLTSTCCSTQSVSISTLFPGKGMFAMISINDRPTVPFVFCIMPRIDLSTNSFNSQKYTKAFLTLFYK